MAEIKMFVDGEYASSMFIEDENFVDIFNNSPKVVPYGHLDYTPELGDTWNGSLFVSKDESTFHSLDGYGNNAEFYAYIVDEKVVWLQSFLKTDQNKMVNAILLSDPTFEMVV